MAADGFGAAVGKAGFLAVVWLDLYSLVFTFFTGNLGVAGSTGFGSFKRRAGDEQFLGYSGRNELTGPGSGSGDDGGNIGNNRADLAAVL